MRLAAWTRRMQSCNANSVGSFYMCSFDAKSDPKGWVLDDAVLINLYMFNFVNNINVCLDQSIYIFLFHTKK